MTLKSTKVTPKGGNDYELVGDLTIRGVTKSVTFDLEFLGHRPVDGPRRHRSLASRPRAEIDRRDFNVNFDGALENGSLVVSNKIVIELAIEAALSEA